MEPTQNEDLGNLSYKTMPQGKSLSDMKFNLQKPAQPDLQKPVAAVPQAAPVPIPSATPVGVPIPKPMGMPAVSPIPSAPTPVPLASHPPIPAEIKPIQTLEGFDTPNHGSFDMRASSGAGMGKWLKIGLITVAVLIVLGVGWFAYKSLFGNKPAPAVVTNNQMNNAPASKISGDWMQKYFNVMTCVDKATCGDDSDPDHDGLTNYQEYQQLTDPNNSDSDKDGLADGDEVNVFLSNPNNADTGGDPQYSDDVQVKTKWSTQAPIHQFTDSDLKQISSSVVQYGLHEPTITTLGPELVDFYTNYGTTSSGSSATNSSSSSAGSETSSNTDALDRDTQRSDTIKQIGFALLDYKKTNLKFPNVTKWDDMILAIKPLIQTKAINTVDPKNVAPYVYTYTAVSSGADFKIGYYSETQNQAITFASKDITAAYNKDQASQRDVKRKADLEQLASALELYSSDNVQSTDPDARVYPPETTWKTDLAPKYTATVPLDPSTNKDYAYTVSANKDSYALQAVLESPPTGKKGYVCDPSLCTYY